MTLTTLQLVPFTPEHLPQAVRLSQQASWPHRLEDWALTLTHSQGVVALDGDEVVGTALASLFGQVATLNMIIVDAKMRGRGLGRQLMNAIIQIAGDRELRLVATTDGLPLYQKLGFEVAGEILQFQGIVSGAKTDIPVAIRAADLTKLMQMDAEASGMDRRDLLGSIAQEGTVLRAERGFAMIRKFGRGQVVGPIVAQDLPTARALLAVAAQQSEGGFLRLDTGHPALGEFAQSLGMEPVGGGTSMTCQPRTQTRTQTQTEFTTFALVSQALG